MVDVTDSTKNATPPVPPSFGVTSKELQDLMALRGREALKTLGEYGGILQLCAKLQTSSVLGISGDVNDYKIRIEVFGSNRIPMVKSKSFLRLVWEALLDSTLIILISAAILSLVLNYVKPPVKDETEAHVWIEGVAILVSVLVVVLVTAFNNFSKERQFRKLQNQIDCELKFPVIRRGEINLIPVTDIAVGDICQVKYGDVVPADGILIQSSDLKLDESSLTGESDYVSKSLNVDPILLSGTNVMEGSGKMVVTAVGINSFAGRIYSLLGAVAEKKKQEQKELKRKHVTVLRPEEPLEQVEVQTPASETPIKTRSVLQEKLTKLAIQIGYVGSVIAILTVVILVVQFFVLNLLIEQKPWDNSYYNDLIYFFIIGVTVLVVAVPEGLPLAVTISLAYSVKKMMQDNNLVRHLDACETMGNATIICSDKTGTLTTNRMTVVQTYIFDKYSKFINKNELAAVDSNVIDIIAQAISLNSNYTSRIVPAKNPLDIPEQVGNRTECALLGFVLELGRDYEKLRENTPEETFERVYTFNSVRKSMSTVIPWESGYRLFTKGASEIIINKCERILGSDGRVVYLNPGKRSSLISNVVEVMAAEGLRTIAIAYRDLSKESVSQITVHSHPNWDDEDNIVNKLTLLCIVGIEDPVRPEVPEAIRTCQQAGITVKMVTGDNINTAKSIAIKCGIYKSGYLALEGNVFNRIIRDENGVVQQHLIDQIWPRLRILARSSPTDKYNLVKGIRESKLRKTREVVAVTGDGTNDGPALKVADVGFSMGISGTDVAKEASDIILTDDNFSSIVKAVMWGRNVYDSITKFLQFQLTVNLVAIVVTFVGACSIQDSPLKAVQMLWINLIMDTMASLALATEKPTPALLKRKPYGRTQPLISNIMYKKILGQSIYQLTVLFVLVYLGDKFINIEVGIDDQKHVNEHFTIVFNTFVLMTLFNEINSRKIHGERNIFSGLFSNPIFCLIWIMTFICQILIVQFGGNAFSTHNLDVDHWMWCFLFGIGTLVWGQFLNFIPPTSMKKIQKLESKSFEIITPNDLSNGSRGKVLWIHGMNKIRSQLKVVNAFKSNIAKLEELRSGLELRLPEINPENNNTKRSIIYSWNQGLYKQGANRT